MQTYPLSLYFSMTPFKIKAHRDATAVAFLDLF